MSMQQSLYIIRNSHFLSYINEYSTVVMIWKYDVETLEINSSASLGTETYIIRPVSNYYVHIYLEIHNGKI